MCQRLSKMDHFYHQSLSRLIKTYKLLNMKNIITDQAQKPSEAERHYTQVTFVSQNFTGTKYVKHHVDTCCFFTNHILRFLEQTHVLHLSDQLKCVPAM